MSYLRFNMLKMDLISQRINRTLKDLGIKTRPHASVGYWVPFLLPLAIIVSFIKNSPIVSNHYKLATIIAAGFIVTTIVIIIQCQKHYSFKIGAPHVIAGGFISFLFITCVHTNVVFSLVSGFSTTLFYVYGLRTLLKICPLSFTFGEAAFVVQGIILFVYMALLNICESIIHTPTKTCHISSLILQVTITGLGIICLLVYKFKYLQRQIPFYMVNTCVVIFWIIIPLHILLKRSPVVWVLHLMIADMNSRKMIIFWAICCMLCCFAVSKQIESGRKASTIVRKIFHILMVLVYIPGLLDQCSLLFLASGFVFVIFVILELVRELNLPPFASTLQAGFIVLSDEKDAGRIALTPIYLLVGCSLPLWIHPQPCDVTDSAGFYLLPLISGVLSVGIGDTMASSVGLLMGSHKWAGSKKTLEGTFACVFGQIMLIFGLIQFGYISSNHEIVGRAIFASIVSSLVEAKTDQIDNIILPLITYIFLV